MLWFLGQSCKASIDTVQCHSKLKMAMAKHLDLPVYENVNICSILVFMYWGKMFAFCS